MPPGQLCNDPLHKIQIWPGGGEGTHVFEAAWRKTLHVGESVAQIGSQTVDDACAVTLRGLLGDDALADVPIQQQHGAVAGQHDAQTFPANPGLDVGQPVGVAGRHFNDAGRCREHGAAVGATALLALGRLGAQGGCAGFLARGHIPASPCSP